ncbi:MAG: hypothetical protein K0S23_2276 [Fluviicola sp.]|jgi:hypothetical protein|uniref:T9SS type A sorting domain-containing protein n=1 Tax=Fluviicola sp. TaxID=1917219 RepID=UPI002624E1A9|nr:T9SS type A sorting domain-containing protein [Fluviicola sp.]MDF3027969.1 hypothetical protein [Fluviicola sp.]
MKKIYSLLSIALLTAAVSTAQVDIKQYETGSASGPNLNGTTITKVASEDELVVIDLAVINKFGSDKLLRITRDKFVDVPAWSIAHTPPEAICWGPVPDPNFEGLCSQPNSDPWTTSNDFTLVNNGLAQLKFDIHTDGPGSIHYRLYIVDGSAKVDSVDVIVTTVLGIKDQKNEEITMSIYPNPVSSLLSVTAQGLDGNFDLKMTDVLGKVVYNESVVGASKKVDVSDFKNGVYLVTVLEKGRVVQTRRVVIKH